MDSSIILYGLSGSILVTMLVQVARTFGLPPRFAPPAAIIAGFIVSAAFHAAQPGPWGSNLNWWIQTVIDGLQLGLGGAGIYSLTTAHQKAKDEEALNNMGVPTSLKSMAVLQGAPLTPATAPTTTASTATVVGTAAAVKGVFVPTGQNVAAVNKSSEGATAVQFTEPEPPAEWLNAAQKAKVTKNRGQFHRLPPPGYVLTSDGDLIAEQAKYIDEWKPRLVDPRPLGHKEPATPPPGPPPAG